MWFGLISLFNDISTFIAYLMPKPSLMNISDTVMILFNQLLGWGGKEIQTFAKGISLKVSAIVILKYELTYFKAAVQHFSYENSL